MSHYRDELDSHQDVGEEHLGTHCYSLGLNISKDLKLVNTKNKSSLGAPEIAQFSSENGVLTLPSISET